MLCPNCRAGCMNDDTYCHRCGTDLTLTTKSLVPTQTHVPALIQNPQLPRVAASVGAIALGVGLELLRRRFVARITRYRVLHQIMSQCQWLRQCVISSQGTSRRNCQRAMKYTKQQCTSRE